MGHIGIPLWAAGPFAKFIERSEVDFAGAARIRNAAIAADLGGVELGGWAVDAESINYLERVLTAKDPSTALEFGSGASTVAIARSMTRGKLVSFDQDEAFAQRTRDLVKRAGLADVADVQTIPIVDWLNEDSSQLTDHILSTTGEGSIQFVFVDGPAGPPGIRGGLLPAILPALSSDAVVMLDDALRGPDLEYVKRWLRLGFKARSIRAIGKGMLYLERRAN